MEEDVEKYFISKENFEEIFKNKNIINKKDFLNFINKKEREI